MEEAYSYDILEMLKALADESRLALLRLLSEREYTVGELAEKIELAEPTVSHHLSRLRMAGLITLRMAGNQRFYSVYANGLARFKRLANEIEKNPLASQPDDMGDNAWIDALDWPAADKQVLRAYTQGGKITSLPAKRSRLIVLLRWLAGKFEPGRMYSEAEVNVVIKSAYETDFVSLRRDLVDMGYLRRERGGGKYWAAPDEQN